MLTSCPIVRFNFASAAEAICVGISSLTGYQIHSGLEVTNFVKLIFKSAVVWGGFILPCARAGPQKKKY